MQIYYKYRNSLLLSVRTMLQFITTFHETFRVLYLLLHATRLIQQFLFQHILSRASLNEITVNLLIFKKASEYLNKHYYLQKQDIKQKMPLSKVCKHY